MTPTDQQLDTALRALDLTTAELSPTERAHKDALLGSLLGAPGQAAAPVAERRPGPHQARPVAPRRRARRAAGWLLPAAAAAGIALAVTLGGGPGESRAYASWTPDPHPVDAGTLALAERACRDAVRDSIGRVDDAPSEARVTTDPAAFRTVVAERRGGFLLLAMAAPDGSEQQCFSSAEDPGHVDGSTGGLATASSTPPAPLASQQLDAHSGGLSSGPEGTYAFTTGRVGSGIRAVTIHASGRTVRASVRDGHFAAWWPTEPGTVNAPAPAETYDVTLVDGRTLTDVPGGDLSAPPSKALGPAQVGVLSTGGGVVEDGPAVVTLEGRAGSDVVSLVVHAGGVTKAADMAQGGWSVELPDGTDAGSPTFDVTLRDGRVLEEQRAVR